jgi:hypothetical protein
MNVHRPNADIGEKHRSLEWRGKPFTRRCRDGKLRTFHRAVHRSMHWTLYYCYEDDFAWFCNANPYW